MKDRYYVFGRGPEGRIVASGSEGKVDITTKVEITPVGPGSGDDSGDAIIQELRQILPPSVEVASDGALLVLKAPESVKLNNLGRCECKCNYSQSCGGGGGGGGS